MTRIAVIAERTGSGQSARTFSLARGLDYQLNPPGESRKFEVIDASIPALDSTMAVEMMRELVRHQIDVVILYVGNNELTGPFGAGSLVSGSAWGEFLTPILAWSTRYQTGSLVHRTAACFQARKISGEWPGMQAFRRNNVVFGDRRQELLHQRYRQNINRMLALAGKRNIRTVVCTIPVNQSDCAPFGSTNRAGLSNTQIRMWNEYFKDGVEAHEAGRLVAARELYEQAASIDDQHAELVYRMAETWRFSGDHETARRLFSRALELDIHRLRADSRINDIIRAECGKHPGTELADLQMTFSTLNDRDLFLDHVHFSANGLQVACRDLLQKLAIWCDVPPAATRDSMMARMARTPWSDLQEAETMILRRRHHPFIGTAGNSQQMHRMEGQRDYALERIASSELDRWAPVFSEKIRARPDDLALAEMWAGILSSRNQWHEAANFLTGVIAPLATITALHEMAALALVMDHRPDEAAHLLARTGPPYGYYLSHAADSITTELLAANRKDDAKTFLQALRREAGRFRGYRKVADRIE